MQALFWNCWGTLNHWSWCGVRPSNWLEKAETGMSCNEARDVRRSRNSRLDISLSRVHGLSYRLMVPKVVPWRRRDHASRPAKPGTTRAHSWSDYASWTTPTGCCSDAPAWGNWQDFHLCLIQLDLVEFCISSYVFGFSFHGFVGVGKNIYVAINLSKKKKIYMLLIGSSRLQN